MRKVVREKDKYERGVYNISPFGMRTLEKNISKVEPNKSKEASNEITWYTVYSLPPKDINSFKSR